MESEAKEPIAVQDKTNGLRSIRRCIREFLIYLKAKAVHDATTEEKLDALITASEAADQPEVLGRISDDVRQLVLRLEINEQHNGEDRAYGLQRLAQISLSQQGTRMPDDPYQKDFAALAQKLASADTNGEVDAVRTEYEALIEKSRLWQIAERDSSKLETQNLVARLLSSVGGSEQTSKANIAQDGQAHVEKLLSLLSQERDLPASRAICDQVKSMVSERADIESLQRMERDAVFGLLETFVQSVAQDAESGQERLLELLDAIRTHISHSTLASHQNQLQQIISNLQFKFEKSNPVTDIQEKLTEAQERVKALQLALDESQSQLSTARSTTPVDEVTSLPDSSAFHRELAGAYENYSRHRMLYCLGIIEIRNLFDIEKQNGEEPAQKCLRAVAGLIRRHIRKVDFGARMDHHRFSIIFPNTTLRGANEVLGRIQQEIETTEFRTGSNVILLSTRTGLNELSNHRMAEEWLTETIAGMLPLNLSTSQPVESQDEEVDPFLNGLTLASSQL